MTIKINITAAELVEFLSALSLTSEQPAKDLFKGVKESIATGLYDDDDREPADDEIFEFWPDDHPKTK